MFSVISFISFKTLLNILNILCDFQSGVSEQSDVGCEGTHLLQPEGVDQGRGQEADPAPAQLCHLQRETQLGGPRQDVDCREGRQPRPGMIHSVLRGEIIGS